MAATAVTPTGVRDGDPDALAGLCDRRGPAVLAYCRLVAGDAVAPEAAAEAFGVFRAAVVAAQDPAQINPEQLLFNAARHAAALRAGIVATGVCAEVPQLLAARADRSITLADLDRLEEHLATCWTCRAPVARFEAAERAYRDPPDTKVSPQDAALIVAAMLAAAPVRTEEPPAPVPAAVPTAAMNGGGHLDPAAEPQQLDQPTTEFRPVGMIDDAPAPAAPAPEPKGARRARRAQRERPAGGGALGALLGAARRPARPAKGAGAAPAPTAAPDPPPTIAAAAPLEPTPAGAGTRLPRAQRSSSSAGLPRRQRGGARPAARRQGSPLRAAVVLPIILVALALLIALFVAGVFGKSDPASSSRNLTPAGAEPASAATTTPEVVEVPGAGDASGKAVELAKARARARERRSKGTATRTTAAAAPPPPPAAAPAAAPPAASANATTQPKASVTKKKAAGTGTSTGTDGGTSGVGIDSSNGATGAEQLPQAADTSTVPELAPPTDPATPAPPG